MKPQGFVPDTGTQQAQLSQATPSHLPTFSITQAVRLQQGAPRAECQPAAPVVCNLLAWMGLPGAPGVQQISNSLFSASAVPEQLALPVLQQAPASPWGAKSPSPPTQELALITTRIWLL